MIDVQTIDTITKICVDTLDLENIEREYEYHYASMPLCVVDSVFSIGTRYSAVTNTIQRVCAFYNIQQVASSKLTIPPIAEQLSTTLFLEMFNDKTPEQLSNEVYQNRQRTSTHSSIRKSEAVTRFLNVLQDFNVEYYQDIPRLVNNNSFEFCITSIPGQRSGISLKYFFMLTLPDDLFKTDRMLIRFLQDVTGTNFTVSQCQELISKVSSSLNEKGYKMTPKLLDNMIWNSLHKGSQRDIFSNANLL